MHATKIPSTKAHGTHTTAHVKSRLQINCSQFLWRIMQTQIKGLL